MCMCIIMKTREYGKLPSIDKKLCNTLQTDNTKKINGIKVLNPVKFLDKIYKSS